MDDWNTFLGKIDTEINSNKCDLLFFRGHNDTTWELTPSLYRVTSQKWKNPLKLEQTLHIDFRRNCGPLYNTKLDDWELLLEMRHSGLPTRLLDWTENFSSALFFALRDVDWEINANQTHKMQPCIWIMDPYQLYNKFFNELAIPEIDHLSFKYVEVIDKKLSTIKKKCPGPMPLIVPRQKQRIFAQKSVFTFHALNYGPIEKICKSCVKKFEIPLNSIEEAKSFLKISGIHEYSMFPDQDGLGRYLKEFHQIAEI